MGRFRLYLIAFFAVFTVAYGSTVDSMRTFKCANGQQIQQMWVCDGEADCNDNSDESPGLCTPNASCGPDKFTCAENGRCIPLSMKCDNEPDCPDKSDEKECAHSPCTKDQFRCGDETCISLSWVCDGTADCSDGLDEAKCNRTCTADEFECGNGICASKQWRCDGDIDCEDGRDEKDCPAATLCPDHLCSDGNCIPKKFVCDGDYDCIDRSDESNCTSVQLSHGLKTCKPNQFECPDRKTCIHESWLCDKQWDCPDGADESPQFCSSTNACASGMFQCENKQCVPESARCDKIHDCHDGSDEHGCHNASACAEGEIDCGSGLCLSSDKACNGIKECANGADESPSCGINECSKSNGNCDHLCVDDPIGYHCECRNGYKLVNTTCVDVNECEETYGACSQLCENSVGSYVCSCRQGYSVDSADPSRCRADVGNPTLLLTKRGDVRKLNLFGGNSSTTVVAAEKSSGLDFIYSAQEIYWSDNQASEPAIYKTDVDGLTAKKKIVDVVEVEGVSIDWIRGNIYFTDTGMKTIETCNLSGSARKRLFWTDIQEPRAIVVDPIDGWMYWTDWGKNARIERAGLDGSNRHTIISRSIRWPNGLTLDRDAGRLYWVDPKFQGVYSANVDGSGRRLVLRSPDYAHHPYSVAVFDDLVIWTDWTTGLIYQADKFDGRGLKQVNGEEKTLQSPMVVQVYHPYKQSRGENLCPAAACSHLCLATPKLRTNETTSVICACPDYMMLNADGKTCRFTPPPSSPIPEQTTPHHPRRPPPIYIDFDVPKTPSLSEQAGEINWLLVLLIILAGSFLTTFVLVSVCACAYRVYIKGNFKIMRFDNPIYHKTSTQDPLCSVESSEPSPPGTPEEEARRPFCTV